MRPQIKFLIALKEAGLKQKDFARIAGENKGRLSMMINGLMFIDEARKIKFARLLGKKPEDLFDDPGPVQSSAAPAGHELCIECRSLKQQDRYK